MKRAMWALAPALLLGGCWKSVGSEDRSGGWINTADGVVVVETRVELSEGPMTPMAHSTPIRIDAARFRAWQVTPGNGASPLVERAVDYHYEGRGEAPGSVVPLGDALVPLACHFSSAWRIDDNRIACDETNGGVRVGMMGGRAMRFAVEDGELAFGPGGACRVPLAADPPGDPYDALGLPPRYSLAPIDARRAYLADSGQPGVALYLLDCGEKVELGTAYDSDLPPDPWRFVVVDMVPDGSIRTPAILSSARQDNPPPPYELRVRRGDGREFFFERVIADDPYNYTFNFDGPPTGFFASDPNTLIYDAQASHAQGMTQVVLSLVDVASGSEEERRYSTRDEGWRDP